MSKSRPFRTIPGNLMLTAVMLFVFSASALTIALSAAQAFKTLESDKDCISNLVIAMSYLNAKVRQNDCADAISVRPGPASSRQALVITEVFDALVCETWIYCQDGKLWEAFIVQGSGVTKDTSALITPLDGFDLSFEQAHGQSPWINIGICHHGIAKQKVLTFRLSLRTI